MGLSGKLGDLPSLDDSCCSITLGNTTDVNVLVIFCTDSIFEQEHVFHVFHKVKGAKIVFVHEGDFRRSSVQIAKSKCEGNDLVWLQNEINEKITENHIRLKFLALAQGSLSYGKAERKSNRAQGENVGREQTIIRFN